MRRDFTLFISNSLNLFNSPTPQADLDALFFSTLYFIYELAALLAVDDLRRALPA
jgi:hypothetical protein